MIYHVYNYLDIARNDWCICSSVFYSSLECTSNFHDEIIHSKKRKVL
jgi:hypothetical protein